MKIKCLALIMVVSCLGLTACGSVVEAKENSKISQIEDFRSAGFNALDTYEDDDFMSAGFNALEVYN